MANFKVSIVTHVKKILEEEIEFLRLRTTEGDLGILANHSPLVAELAMGKLELVYNKDKRDIYFLSGGFLEISNNQATIIADEVVRFDEINLEEEKKYLEKNKNLLLKLEPNSEEVKKLDKKIKESSMKIELKNSL